MRISLKNGDTPTFIPKIEAIKVAGIKLTEKAVKILIILFSL